MKILLFGIRFKGSGKPAELMGVNTRTSNHRCIIFMTRHLVGGRSLDAVLLHSTDEITGHDVSKLVIRFIVSPLEHLVRLVGKYNVIFFI